MWEIIFVICLLYVQNSAFGFQREWEPNCVGDEFSGTCVEPHRCLSTNPYAKGLVYPLKCTMTNGKRGVCCTDCYLVTNSSDAHLDHGGAGLLWKTGRKAWDKCLEYSQRYKFVTCPYSSSAQRYKTDANCHQYRFLTVSPAGGSDVVRGEYPHMALLGYTDTVTASQWLCSGSLISERFIITAGHCIYSRELGQVTEAALGVLKRSDPPEYWRRYKIKRAVPHPQYKPPASYNDIALLETEIPVTFIAHEIVPACLPVREDKVQYEYDERFAPSITATGWGYLGYRMGLADTMQKVTLNPFSKEDCNEMYPIHRHQRQGINYTTQMCYGHKTIIRDTCQGDSGGPLQEDTRYPSCMHTIIGVTSYGQQCGFAGGAGVYTKVVAYMPWIESVVFP